MSASESSQKEQRAEKEKVPSREPGGQQRPRRCNKKAGLNPCREESQSSKEAWPGSGRWSQPNPVPSQVYLLPPPIRIWCVRQRHSTTGRIGRQVCRQLQLLVSSLAVHTTHHESQRDWPGAFCSFPPIPHQPGTCCWPTQPTTLSGSSATSAWPCLPTSP